MLAILLVGCNNEVTEEQTPQPKEESSSEEIKYGEQISQEDALAAISFIPKQISKSKEPFPIKKRSAILHKSDKPTEIIELSYGGVEYNILLKVENTEELKQDTSLDTEKLNLLQGKKAYYAEDQYIQYIAWIDNELSYLMSFHYKGNLLNKADVFSKEDILEIIDKME